VHTHTKDFSNTVRCYDSSVRAPLLDVKQLCVEFPARRDAHNRGGLPATVPSAALAVRELSFSIAPGEVLGLVGESGSGKSVTSLAIMRLLPHTAKVSGRIILADPDRSADHDLLTVPEANMRQLRGSRMAMIFQEPMTALNPVMRVGDQVAEAILTHCNENSRIGKRDLWGRVVAALEDVAIVDPARRARDYPHQLSGGIRQRVMIAMAIVNRPQLLIADEPTTALDVTIQAQILELLMELREKFGLAMLFISHDLAVVSQVADRVAVMYGGNLVELGRKDDIFKAAAHPYSRGLLHAVPTLRTDRSRPLQTIEGTVPPAYSVPPGCPFESRCEYRVSACSKSLPDLLEVAPGHWARCPVLNDAEHG
jgi:peptide/nickel transport system ATP-binding protein